MSARNPALIKRSLNLSGHATSVALETGFWEVLEMMAAAHASSGPYGGGLTALVARVDAGRGTAPLTSALRVHVLDHLRARAGLRS